MIPNSINSIGTHQSLVRVCGKAYLGLGHTAKEARKNAMDLACESMKCEAHALYQITCPIPVERTGHQPRS